MMAGSAVKLCRRDSKPVLRALKSPGQSCAHLRGFRRSVQCQLKDRSIDELHADAQTKLA